MKAKKSDRNKKSSSKSASFFAGSVQPKLKVNTPGDAHEQQADRISDQVISGNKKGPVSAAHFFGPPPARVQREEKDKSGDVLSEGASITYDQLKLKPGYETWETKQTDALKYKLWTSQSSEYKAGIIGFGLANLGILGTAFAVDPNFRADTIDLLNDKNIALPLKLLPYSEYFGLSSFKYKLPGAAASPYTFDTEFEFDAWLALMRKKWGGPKIGLSAGVQSAYSKDAGFSPVTGGNVKLTFGGGIINLSGVFNGTLPATPMLINNPGGGNSPMWLMRTLPDQLSGNLPKGYGAFLTVDIARLPELWSSKTKEPQPSLQYQKKVWVQRKENSAGTVSGTSATPDVHQALTGNQGKPLDKGTRRDMESRFGQDFSHVRIQTSAQAAESAQSINAKAYTSGNQIVFGSGQYRPGTMQGKRLLAHELVHVNQQTGIVHRKESSRSVTAAKSIREKLLEGKYISAYFALDDYVRWLGNQAKKKWLHDHSEIRLLFLKNLPPDTIADIYSVAQLLLKPVHQAFSAIDCWYQLESEKRSLYSAHMNLFDRMLRHISPYSGQRMITVVERLTAAIKSKKYISNRGNKEFHTLHLLAPTVDRKIKFYKKYKGQGLFKETKKKFDPFTGLRKSTFETLTDTNEVDRKKALQLYRIMKNLPEEQRRAFLDVALFSGSVEADKDAEKYYRKYYKKQYKALPHNWDFAFWPWNWEAPFADRLTVDHAALMSSALNYEDKAVREFGFDLGIDKDSSPSPGDPTGKKESDANRLLKEMKKPANFNSYSKLAILLAIAVRGGLQKRVTSEVLKPKHDGGLMSKTSLAIVKSYGFDRNADFAYRKEIVKAAKYDTSIYSHILDQTLFGGDSGKVWGEQRGTFDLRKLQASSMMRGSIGGLRFSGAKYKDDYYNTTWLDNAVKGHKGSSTLAPNLKKTKNEMRTSKIFASIRDDVRQANIYAGVLPIEGPNFFSDGTLYRSGRGVLKGLALHLSWAKDSSESNNSVDLTIDIENILLNHFQTVSPKKTLTIGSIGVKGFRIRLKQNKIAGAEGFWLGLMKNADFSMNVLLYLLPNVLKLLPYTAMAVVEEFSGGADRTYKDIIGEIAKNDFSALDMSVTFTHLRVRNIYDTTAGFLDDITISAKKKDKKTPARQGIRVKETMSWTIDAMFDIKRRIKKIDERIRKVKADIAGSEAAENILALENEKERLMKIAVDKGLKRQDRFAEMEQIRAIMTKLRKENERLENEFNAAKATHPLYSPSQFDVVNAERKALTADLNYLDNQYFEDIKKVKSSGHSADRFIIRKRLLAYEAKYKSFDVRMAFRGIDLKGGGYVKDMINDLLKSVGFINPKLEGIENIKIGAVDGAYTVSSRGASKYNKETGIAVKNLRLPLITATQLAFKSNSMLIEGGNPIFENIRLSVALDFVKNPLDRVPGAKPKYILSNLTIKHALFTGLSVKMGGDVPLLDFPANEPVEIWGLRLWDYDPDKGNINLRINDVKAKGKYTSTSEDKTSSENVEFGLDTTLDNRTKQGKKPALILKYDKSENSIETRVNIGSAWIPSLDIQSPEFELQSIKGTDAIELTNLQADVKMLFAKDATKTVDKATGKMVEKEAARPLTLEIRKIHLGKIKAKGLTARMIEYKQPAQEGDKPSVRSVQEVSLPKSDDVSVENINVSGLRVLLHKGKTELQTIDDNASIKIGATDLGGVTYKEKSARGSVLKSLTVHRGKFNALTLEALGRNGRTYTPKEFFKFFGKTRLEGLDTSGTFKQGKSSSTVELKGKKGKPISVDYVEGKDDKPGYYKIRLPLEEVALPALHIEKDGHIVIIPKAKRGKPQSKAMDVDVKLKAYADFNKKDKLVYDIYLEALSIRDLKVFGLEYHNKSEGIDVILSKDKALHVPNVKAGGFRFTSWKGIDVFGKKGGWVNAAHGAGVIEASVDSIHAALTNGSFLAEKDVATGRSALDVNIESFGFRWDKHNNMFINLGAVSGGFPSMTISQKDPTTGVKSITTIKSKDSKAVTATGVEIKLGADKNNIITATGLTAGGINIVNTKTKGLERSTTTLKLDSKALGATKVEAKLNADKSREITISGIKGGKLDLSFISTGKKGKSEAYIRMPDPEQIDIKSLIIAIDPAGVKKYTIVQPTIKRFALRVPSQAKVGDYFKVVCDLEIKGNMELGDGSIEKLAFEAPYDAFVGVVEDKVPVKISNVKIEYKDTAPAKSPAAKATGRTPNQIKLLDLERARDKAHSEMIKTPSHFYHAEIEIENPEFWPAVDRYKAAKKAYESHRTSMIAGAKRRASKSMTKKYLDAISGTAHAKLKIFSAELDLNLETYKGQHYVEFSQKLVNNFRSVIMSIWASTKSMKFWKSKEIKAIGEGLNRWWLSWFSTPTAQSDINAIASGDAHRVVGLLLRDVKMWPGVLENDKKQFGINLDIEGYWGLDLASTATDWDEIGIALGETRYKHPSKKDYYSLYGMIEYLQYVNPTLVSLAADADKASIDDALKSLSQIESKVNDKGIGKAVGVLVAFIQRSLMREVATLKRTVSQNIHGVDIDADVSLRPQEVIRELLKEKKAGSLELKGSKSIDDLHIEGSYKKGRTPAVEGSIGGGAKGIENIVIPGGEYNSQDKNIRAEYGGLEIAPVGITYDSDLLKVVSDSAKISGLKFGFKNK